MAQVTVVTDLPQEFTEKLELALRSYAQGHLTILEMADRARELARLYDVPTLAQAIERAVQKLNGERAA